METTREKEGNAPEGKSFEGLAKQLGVEKLEEMLRLLEKRAPDSEKRRDSVENLEIDGSDKREKREGKQRVKGKSQDVTLSCV